MGKAALPAYKSLAEKFGIILNVRYVFNRFEKLGPVELKCKTVPREDLKYLQRF